MEKDRVSLATLALAKAYTDEHGGGGGGTSNYNDLTHKPTVNGVEFKGTMTGATLGLVDAEDGKGLSTNDYTDADKSIVGGVTSALAGKVDKVSGKGLSDNNYSDTDKGIVDGVTTALSGKADASTVNAILDGQSLDSFGDVESALADKVSKSSTNGLLKNNGAVVVAGDDGSLTTITNMTPQGDISYALRVTQHDEIPQEGETEYGLPSDMAVRGAVKSAYDLIKDTVGWSGKNMLPNTASSNGIFTVNANKTITANGTPQSDVYIRPYIFEAGSLPSGNYILSGCPDGGSTSTYEIQLYDTTTSTVAGHNYGGDTPVTIDDTHRYGVLVYVRTGTVASDLLFKPMLRDADILDDTYEPYFGSTAFPRSEQAVLGAKNLLSPYYTGNKQRTVSTALVVTSNDDGTVTFNGTPSDNNSIDIKRRVPNNNNTDMYLPIGKYTMSVDESLSGIVGLSVNLTVSGSAVRIGASGELNYANFEITSNTQCDYKLADGSCLVNVNLVYVKDHVYDNVLIHPMLRLASDPDDTYVPYAMTNKELTEKVQGIIDAATNAADFAAFKTAIGNL